MCTAHNNWIEYSENGTITTAFLLCECVTHILRNKDTHVGIAAVISKMLWQQLAAGISTLTSNHSAVLRDALFVWCQSSTTTTTSYKFWMIKLRSWIEDSNMHFYEFSLKHCFKCKLTKTWDDVLLNWKARKED